MVFDLRANYATDKVKELEGVWEEVEDGAELLIARIGNDNYQREYNSIPRAVRKQIEDRSINSDRAVKYMARILASTILLDWKGIGEVGKVVKYSRKVAEEYLIKYPGFMDLVLECGNEQRRFSDLSMENDVKNSERSSSGN